MQNEDLIRQIAQQVYDQNSTQDQFAVSQTPFHTHNGADSPKINYADLANKGATITFVLPGILPATAGNYKTFFTAPSAMVVRQITEVHTVAGSDGGTVSLDIEKLTGVQAPSAGVKLTASPFSLKSTANTVVSATLISNSNLQLAAGDRLAALLTGTPTDVTCLVVTIALNS